MLASDDLIPKFMYMVGQQQWAVTLGRYDNLAHVMSMSRFRLAPKVGHIERMKRIYGYLSRTKHYALRFRTAEPNYMHLPDLEYDWTRIYGDVLEEIPKDAPEPLGKSVTTTFLDANLLHDLITGRSVTAVLHFFNLTPGDWYSRDKQLLRMQPMDQSLLLPLLKSKSDKVRQTDCRAEI